MSLEGFDNGTILQTSLSEGTSLIELSSQSTANDNFTRFDNIGKINTLPIDVEDSNGLYAPKDLRFHIHQ